MTNFAEKNQKYCRSCNIREVLISRGGRITKHFVLILLIISKTLHVSYRAIMLNKMFGVTQGQHMTDFTDIKFNIVDW